MKHIHFVIYKLKVLFLYFVIFYLFLFINLFLLFYSEIEFIKLLDDIKIQRKTFTFTKDEEFGIVFINKMINSEIMRMFIFLYNFYIYIFYFISQVLCICTDDWGTVFVNNFC
jgi:hypothetical protein